MQEQQPSQTCGQPDEGAGAAGGSRTIEPRRYSIDQLGAAIATLDQLGYSYTGGMLWKPPLGKRKPTALEIATRLSYEYPTTECPLILDLVIDTLRILGGGKTKFERTWDRVAAGDAVGFRTSFDGKNLKCDAVSAAEFYRSSAEPVNASDDIPAEAYARETESLAHRIERLENGRKYDNEETVRHLLDIRKTAEGDRIEFRRALERIVESIRNVTQGVESVRELNRQTNMRLTGVDAACASAWSSLTESVAGKGCELPAVPLVEQIVELRRLLRDSAKPAQTPGRIPGIHTDP